MRDLHIAPVFWIAFLVFAFFGCGGSSPAISQKSPVRPIERTALLKFAKEFGDEKHFIIRYNPPKCDCPPFEIELKSEWHRVVMEDANPETGELEKLTQVAEDDMKQDILSHYHVQGSLEDELHPCAIGHLHLMFRLEKFSKDKITPEGE
jgi:hypothetical protein